jgi:hypothetical protein
MKKFVSLMIAVLFALTGSIALFGQGAATSEKLASGNYMVYAVSPQVWRFTVDSKTMANATVAGHFAISAGVPKNIDVYVFNEENFTKWRSEDEAAKAGAKPLFSLLKKDQGDLNVKLADAGIYYLVFSNLSAYEGTKALDADVKLQYDKR